MKKEEFKIIVTLSVVIAGIIAILYISILGKTLDSANFFKSLSFGLSSVTFFWFFFIYFGWNWPLLNLIFYRPDLNGTWSGVLISDWKDEDENSIDPIPFCIVIRQSFLRVHLTTFTKDFIGRSYAENFSLKKHEGMKNISYLYRKDSSQNNNAVLQEGGAELRLIEEKDKLILEGKYWTNQKTCGTITIERLSEQHSDSYEQAIKLKK